MVRKADGFSCLSIGTINESFTDRLNLRASQGNTLLTLSTGCRCHKARIRISVWAGNIFRFKIEVVTVI